jgi:hypothetical protein
VNKYRELRAKCPEAAPLPAMPLFLERGLHVMVPLEATYQATWNLCPEPIREMVEAAE